MVTVKVLDENDHMHAEGNDNRVNLAIVAQIRLPAPGQEVDHLLNSSGSVHIQGNVDQVLGNRLADDTTLLVGRVLQQLLAKVVAEGV